MSNPFEILGVEARFDLDPDELHRKFIQVSVATHPDRFTDPLDQADAAARAAVINEAHRALADPETRANALLVLLGGSAKEQDKSLPPALLMEVMEVREQLERAITENDRPTLKRLRAWGEEAREAHLSRIAELFGAAAALAEGDRKRTETLKAIRSELNALRYFQRMIEQAPG